MKHTLYNTLGSKYFLNLDNQTSFDISHSSYLLSSQGIKQTIAYLFNDDFTDISKVFFFKLRFYQFHSLFLPRV